MWKIITMEYSKIWSYEQQLWADKFVKQNKVDQRQLAWNKKFLAEKKKQKEDEIQRNKKRNELKILKSSKCPKCNQK